MKAPFRSPFIRATLLGAAMVTAYLLGRAHGLATLGQSAAATHAKPMRKLTALEEASKYFGKAKDLITHKIGNVLLSVDSDGHYYIGKIAIGRLLKTDPQQALLELAKLPHGAETNAAYRDAFNELFENSIDDPDAKPSAEDSAKTVALAETLLAGPERTAAMLGIADGWARADAPAALAWASSLPTTDGAVLKEAMMRIWDTNATLAAQYINDLTNASDRNEAIGHIAGAWGYTDDFTDTNTINPSDPAAALDWLNQVATGKAYDDTVDFIFFNLMQTDPAQSMALLDKVTDPTDRSSMIWDLTHGVGKAPMQATLDWLQTLPDADAFARTAGINSMLTTWANQNLQEATAYVSGASNPAVFLAEAPILAPAMAKTDPQAALNWVSGFPDSPAKTQAQDSVLATLTATNANGAWNYATNLPAGSAQDGALSSVVTTLAATDFNSAWADATSLPAGPARDNSMESVVSVLSATNPAQAATMLGQLGSDDAAVSAASSIATNWVKQDPAALTAWINTQPAGSVRDAAVTAYVDAQDKQNPSAAYALANTMDDPTQRAAQVQTALVQWAKTDLPAADAAAQTANLSDSQRASLLVLLSQASGPPPISNSPFE